MSGEGSSNKKWILNKMEFPTVTYSNEISLMMFGFGDSHKPNPETVRLIESIVLKQLRTIVQEALKYTDGKNLNGTELVFLMRHNKYKMRRFVKYLVNKKQKTMLQMEQMQSKVYEIDQVLPKCALIDFIERIDETGEFTDIKELDEVKLERELRADRISRSLDERKYFEFCKARRVSFNSKGIVGRSTEKLRLWIDPKQEINFNTDALEVLAYYAFQTVAEIIDFAFLVRMDAKSGSDPMKHLSGSYYTATMFNGEHRFSGNNPDFTKVYSGQNPISVSEIREVMRRVHTPQAGKLNFGGKLPETQFLFAI